MRILGIDPGTKESAYVIWDDAIEEVIEKDILPNAVLANIFSQRAPFWLRYWERIAIEMIDNNGQAVGNETFETVLWIGVFLKSLGCDLSDIHKYLVYRRKVKINLCGTMKGIHDSNVRMALINRFGPPGVKAAPGKLYKVTSHMMSALAVAVTFSDLQKQLNR